MKAGEVITAGGTVCVVVEARHSIRGDEVRVGYVLDGRLMPAGEDWHRAVELRRNGWAVTGRWGE